MSLIVVAAGANRSAAFILPDVTLPEEANVCTAHLSYDGTREERVVDFHHVPKDGDTYLALEEKLEPRTLREFLVDLLQSETLRIRFDHHGLDRSFDVGMAREFLEEQRGRSNAWQEE
ncbi:MAG: hypothetical protein Q4F72_05850 [Desulfovibrionaceae bacterium]|nr:hypothetical protein [Desulfovibrionaceae bacterium]